VPEQELHRDVTSTLRGLSLRDVADDTGVVDALQRPRFPVDAIVFVVRMMLHLDGDRIVGLEVSGSIHRTHRAGREAGLDLEPIVEQLPRDQA